MGSAPSYLRCQESALHMYGPVTSAAGAAVSQIPSVYPSEQVQPMLSYGYVGLLQHGLENCCQIRRDAGFRELSQPGLFHPKFSLSAWFWEAVLSPLQIKAFCLSLANTSVWCQCREEEGLGRVWQVKGCCSHPHMRYWPDELPGRWQHQGTVLSRSPIAEELCCTSRE